MRYVNRGEVVEVLDVSVSPPDRQLRSFVFLVVSAISSASWDGRHVPLLLALRLRLSKVLILFIVS